jgi:tetraprenyl-beta-curcumene synthase
MDRTGQDRETRRVALYVAFARAAARYWLSVFPRVLLELRRRRKRAKQICGPADRSLALDALAKRSNVEGAAALAAFAPRRARNAAVRALVSFQALYDYTDLLAEQPADDPAGEARRLHEALPAVFGSCRDVPTAGSRGCAPLGDAAYMDDLVRACREALAALPSLAVVAPLAREVSERIVLFQSLGTGGHGELKRWAQQLDARGDRDGRAPRLTWWEIAAIAGSSLPVHTLLAAAAAPGLEDRAAERLCDAYSSEISALHSLLDSVVDREEDIATGQLSLIECYATPEEAANCLARLAREAVRAAGELPTPSAHVLLVTAMACSYLDAARRSRGEDPASIDPDVLAERVRGALGPAAAPVMFVFKLRGLAGRLAHATSPRQDRGPARGTGPAPLAPSDSEPRDADARAA